MIDEKESGPRFPVVGIGASAGGVEALERFFQGLPPASAAAFVVVLHRSADFESQLRAVLRRHTAMEVTEVTEAVRIEPGRVYLAAPRGHLTLEDGVLRLAPAPGRARLPIDVLFRSLATERGSLAAGVVLSGSGTDGTLGLEEILASGGLAMVQTEASAGHPGMPHSVLSSISIDFAGTPREIAEFLAARLGGDQEPRDSGDQLDRILSTLRRATGHDFSAYKKSTVGRRVARRMTVHQLETQKEYAELLEGSPEESANLFRELLIHVTSFFRDPEAFDVLAGALRDYLEDLPEGYRFRVWVPGCSSGEEAYSLAMLIAELLGELERDLEVQIFATDLDSKVIALARRAVYPEGIALDLGPERLRRHFSEVADGYRIASSLRDSLVFAPHNLIQDPPFSKLDLIACRNLLIYFDLETQKRILARFPPALRPGGLLLLGPSESAGDERGLSAIDKRWKLYRRAPGLPEGDDRPIEAPVPAVARALERSRAEAPEAPLPRRDLDEVLLSTRVPPTVLVDPTGAIAHIHGRTGQFLEPAPGSQERVDVLDMTREGLRLDLSAALRRASETAGDVVHRGVRVKHDGGDLVLDLRVSRLESPTPLRGHYLVSFERAEPAPTPVDDEGGHEVGERILELERRLESAREAHQSTVDELETSNEELKSTNEELHSAVEELQNTNEELETAKEELQSLNEELHTVNAELEKKVEELYRSNDDMKNLLNGTDIATIFLDSELSIKSYTEQARQVVRVIPSDIGRPIGDLVSRLQYHAHIEDDARAVLTSMRPKEAEVKNDEGHWYLMRILPYRTAKNVIDGLVLTFVNITRIKSLQGEQERILEALEDSPASVFGQDAELRYRWTCGPMFGTSRPIGRTDAELLPPESAERLVEAKRRVLESGRRVSVRVSLGVDGRERTYELFIGPLWDEEGGEVTGLSGVAVERKALDAG